MSTAERNPQKDFLVRVVSGSATLVLQTFSFNLRQRVSRSKYTLFCYCPLPTYNGFSPLRPPLSNTELILSSSPLVLVGLVGICISTAPISTARMLWGNTRSCIGFTKQMINTALTPNTTTPPTTQPITMGAHDGSVEEATASL